MRCTLCDAFHTKYPLTPDGKHQISEFSGMGEVKCAWEGDAEFSPGNWSCQTLLALRTIAYAATQSMKPARMQTFSDIWDDDSIAVLRIPRTPDDQDDDTTQSGGFLVLSWYKSRGHTHCAIVHGGTAAGENGDVLSLETAERMLVHYDGAGPST